MSRKTKKNFRKQKGGANQSAQATQAALQAVDKNLNNETYRNAVQTIVASSLCLKFFATTIKGKYIVEKVQSFLESCGYETEVSQNLALTLEKNGIGVLAKKFGFPYKQDTQSVLLTDAHNYLITSKALNAYYNNLPNHSNRNRSDFINFINIKLASDKLQPTEEYFENIIKKFNPAYEVYYPPPPDKKEPLYNLASPGSPGSSEI